MGKKVPFWQFFRKANRIISKLACVISKILFILGSYKFLAYLECIRSYAWSFGYSDPDPSNVALVLFSRLKRNLYRLEAICRQKLWFWMQNASKSVQISGLTNKGKYAFYQSPYKYTYTNFVWSGCLKGDEFNGNALSKVVASFCAQLFSQLFCL